MTYYMIIDGQQVGPLNREDLLVAGLTPQTPVWRDGMAEWQPASQLGELSDLLDGGSAFGAYAQPEEPQPNYGNPHGGGYHSNPNGYGPQQRPYGQQQPYGQDFYRQNPYGHPQYGYQAPTNWMTWAIVGTILGFFFSCIGAIFGIIGINAASKANAAYAAGDYINGDSNNSTAKTMTIVSLVVAGIGLLAAIGIVGNAL